MLLSIILLCQHAGIVEPEVWHPAEAAWQSAAGKLRDSKALDPGGWSHEALKAIWRSPGPRTQLIKWLNQVMWESDQHWSRLLLVHRPVLLSKPGTDAVRPILISTAWHKLVTSAATFTLKPLLLPTIEDTQFGVGAPAGADNSYCRLTTLAQQHPEEVFVQLDMSNAFGNINRQTVLQAIQRLTPNNAITPWLSHFLRTPTIIAVPAWARDGGDSSLHATSCGLAQGDPLSSILCGSTIAWLLMELQAQTGVRPHAYVDDIVLHGNLETLDAALTQIATGWPDAGLRVNHAKCQVWSPQPPAQIVGCPQLMRHADGHWEQRLVICAHCLCQEGQHELPLGSPDFLSQWLQRKASRLARLCENLSYLPDVLGAQDPWHGSS